MAAAAFTAAVVAFSGVAVQAAPARVSERPALKELVLVPPLTAGPGQEKPREAPPRTVIPGTPPDPQAPAPNRIRPNLFVMWFGPKAPPANAVPPDSTPQPTVEPRGRVRDILFD